MVAPRRSCWPPSASWWSSGGRAEPRRRGHDDHRRDLRLRRGGRTGSPFWASSARRLGGAGLSLIFGLLTQFLLSNQVATGLALTLFGLGLSALLGQGYVGSRPPPTPSSISARSPISRCSAASSFPHDWMVYLSSALVARGLGLLTYTRAGLILRAVGENHDAAHALGYKVVRVRLAAIAFGGACAGWAAPISASCACRNGPKA
jgi:ABC-type uncharacterized transport system permease subunit